VTRALLLAAALLASCASQHSLRPFTSDGCSLFPDRSPIGKSDWCACCLAHDMTYWRGGTEQERKLADEQFHACLLAATGDRLLADSMLAGVRVGGTPHIPTPFRWGYGWPADRGYKALTRKEKAMVERERLAARHTPGVCPIPN
jgi:hypothetical protein